MFLRETSTSVKHIHVASRWVKFMARRRRHFGQRRHMQHASIVYGDTSGIREFSRRYFIRLTTGPRGQTCFCFAVHFKAPTAVELAQIRARGAEPLHAIIPPISHIHITARFIDGDSTRFLELTCATWFPRARFAERPTEHMPPLGKRRSTTRQHHGDRYAQLPQPSQWQSTSAHHSNPPQIHPDKRTRPSPGSTKPPQAQGRRRWKR